MAGKKRVSGDYVVPRIGDNECGEDDASSLGSVADEPNWYADSMVAAVGRPVTARPLDRLMRK